MFFRSTTHAPVSRTALRAGAAAFAVGIIGAGLVTTGASAELEDFQYSCTSEADDYELDLALTLDTDAPESAEEGERFRVDPVTASATLPAAEVETLINDGVDAFSGRIQLTMYAVPEGLTQGDDGSQEGTVTLEFDSVDLPDDPSDAEDIELEATSTGEYKAYGTGTDSLRIEAGAMNFTIGKALGENAGEAETFQCGAESDQYAVIDTIKLTEAAGQQDAEDEGAADESDPNANVPTAVNGGL